MLFKVSISNDLSLILYPPTQCLHDYLGPIPPAPTAYSLWGVAVDSPTPMFWPPGMAFGQNKLTTKTLHKALPICVAGHDVGTAIVHVQVAPSPSNSLTALHILFSSRKAMFMASTVLLEGKPVVACTLTNLPPAPMLACADPVSLPTGGAPTSHLNTLFFGMTPLDYGLGWASIGLTMLADGITAALPGDAPTSVTDEIVGKITGGNLANWAIKQAAGLASGALRLAFTDGPASLTLGVGAPFLNVGAELGRDANGEWSIGASGQVGTLQGKPGYNVSKGEMKSEVTAGDPLGSQGVKGDSGSGEVTGESTHYSPNPANWGAPL